MIIADMGLDLLILGTLLILSAFFSGSETALTSLSKARAESLLEEGRHGGPALARLKGNPNRMLIALLIGNNLVNIAASAMTTVLATRLFGAMGPGLAVGVLTLAILIFGEIVPKTFAARHATRLSLIVSPPLLLFSRLAFPLVWILEHFALLMQNLGPVSQDPQVTESELLALARHGVEEGSIEQDEHQMIKRIFAFDDMRAEHVMTPRYLVYALAGSLTIREALPEMLKRPHSRFPLHPQGKPDEINRIVHLREVLAQIAQDNWDRTLDAVGHDPLFAPLNQPAAELFEQLRSKKNRTVIVVDAYGQLAGLFTLEDMLEELVGEITDEMEPEREMIREIPTGELLAEGGAELRLVAEKLGTPLHGMPSDTVSMWILQHAQRIPVAGDAFEIDGLTVAIVRVTRRRIIQVRISRPGPAEAAAPA